MFIGYACSRSSYPTVPAGPVEPLVAIINQQIPSSIPGGTHSDLFRMLSPTAKYFPDRSNLQKFYSQKSHKSVLASSRL